MSHGRSQGWLLAALLLGGCQGGDSAATVTGGLSLEMHVVGEQNLSVFYRVDENGMLGFGGGVDARERNVSWTGPMTEEEIERLRELVREHGWYDRKPTSTGEPEQRVYRIAFRSPEGSRRFTVRGASPDITPIENLLSDVSRGRLHPFLDSLIDPDRIESQPQNTTQSTPPDDL